MAVQHEEGQAAARDDGHVPESQLDLRQVDADLGERLEDFTRPAGGVHHRLPGHTRSRHGQAKVRRHRQVDVGK